MAHFSSVVSSLPMSLSLWADLGHHPLLWVFLKMSAEAGKLSGCVREKFTCSFLDLLGKKTETDRQREREKERDREKERET